MYDDQMKVSIPLLSFSYLLNIISQVVVDSLENWWLDYRKCYLIGEPDDPADADLLNQLVSEALSVVKKTGRTPTSDEETSLRLLTSSHSFMTSAQVARGLMRIFGVPAKSDLVTDLLAYFRSAQIGLQHLKTVKRKPVFLVLDKVINILLFRQINNNGCSLGYSTVSVGKYGCVDYNTYIARAVSTFPEFPFREAFFQTACQSKATSDTGSPFPI